MLRAGPTPQNAPPDDTRVKTNNADGIEDRDRCVYVVWRNVCSKSVSHRDNCVGEA